MLLHFLLRMTASSALSLLSRPAHTRAMTSHSYSSGFQVWLSFGVCVLVYFISTARREVRELWVRLNNDAVRNEHLLITGCVQVWVRLASNACERVCVNAQSGHENMSETARVRAVLRRRSGLCAGVLMILDTDRSRRRYIYSKPPLNIWNTWYTNFIL